MDEYFGTSIHRSNFKKYEHILNAIDFAINCCGIPEQCLFDSMMAYIAWVDLTGNTDLYKLLFHRNENNKENFKEERKTK